MAKKNNKILWVTLLSIFTLAALLVFCILSIVWLPYSFWTKGGAAAEAKSFLRESPTVQNEVGKVLSFDRLPSGSIQVINGSGRARLVFSIHGRLGEARAEVRLTKAAHEKWEVISAVLFFQGREIPLMKGKGGLPPPPLETPRERNSPETRGGLAA